MKKLQVIGYNIDQKPDSLLGKLITPLTKILWILFILFLCLLGISLILDSLGVYDFEDVLLDYDYVIVLSVSALIYFFVITSKTTNKLVKLFFSLMLITGVAIIIIASRHYILYVIQYGAGILTIVTGILVLINTFRQIRDKTNFIYTLIVGLIYLFIGCLIIFSEYGLNILTLLIGIYLVLLSLNILKEVISGRLFIDKIRFKKNIITFPTIFSTFLTVGLFNQVELLADKEKNDGKHFKPVEAKSHGAVDKGLMDKTERPDMTVFIHIREGLVGGAGHVDLAFDGKVYCYGEYDEEAQYYKGLLRDGVLAVMSPREHVKRAVQEEGKILAAYGIKLSEKEKKRVRKTIDKIMSTSYRWQPKAEQAELGIIEGNPEDFKDPASNLFNFSNAEIYKFKEKSPFKTYYLLGQNCSIVANKIIKATGINLRKINGIVTPGTTLNYMEELYKMPNSKVFERILYKGTYAEEQVE